MQGTTSSLLVWQHILVTPRLIILLTAGAVITVLIGIATNWLRRPKWAKLKVVVPGLVFLAIASILITLGVEGLKDTDDSSLQTPSPSGDAASRVTTAEPTTMLSARDRYISAAERVCEKYFIATGKLDQENLPNDEKLRRGIRIMYSMVNEWRAIPPPPGDRPAVDEILDGYNEFANLLYEVQMYQEGGDIERAKAALNKSERIEQQVHSKGRQFGFRLCGSA
jgi:hypothetical protein